MADRGRFLLEYIELLRNERVREEEGFRHSAGDARPAHSPSSHDRWIVNKLRALGSWYTKGLDNGSHLRTAINSVISLPALCAIIDEFFLSGALESDDESRQVPV